MLNPGWPIVVLFPAFLAGGAMREAVAAELHPAAVADQQQRAPNSVQALDYSTLAGGRTIIRLTFQHELSEPPAVLRSYHPTSRIVFDFANTTSALGKEPVEVGQRTVRSLHVVQSGTRTRLVINLGGTVVYETASQGKELLITLQRPRTVGPSDAGRWSPGAASDAPRHRLHDVI